MKQNTKEYYKSLRDTYDHAEVVLQTWTSKTGWKIENSTKNWLEGMSEWTPTWTYTLHKNNQTRWVDFTPFGVRMRNTNDVRSIGESRTLLAYQRFEDLVNQMPEPT